MYAADWLQAADADALLNEWVTLDLSHKGRKGRLRVSADGVRVCHPSARPVRESGGAFAVEQVAQTLGGVMLTAKLLEQKHVQADVIIHPLVAGLIKPGGTVRNTTAAEHSAALDRSIQGAVPFTNYAAGRAQSKVDHPTGLWNVSNIGKLMVLDHKSTAHRCVNHGWIVHESQVRGATWLGIPVRPAVSAPGWYVIQLRGAAHGFGPRGTDQDDYSQLVLIADGSMWIEGEGDIDTATVYTHPDLCGFVTHDGKPLKWAHHPNVPLVVNAPVDDTDLAPTSDRDTDPSVFEEWLNPELTHGERAVEWMLAQLNEGVREQPMGSNNGPEVGEWLGACVRDGVLGFGTWLKKTGGSWCAAAACAADTVTRLLGDPDATHKTRASGIEMENDAKQSRSWRPSALVASGEFTLERGDIVILPRGKAGSWKRHVCRFVRWIDIDAGLIETIGGNESNRFMLTQRAVTDALGYIEMPDPLRPVVMVELPEDEIRATAALVADAGNPWDDGNTALGGDLLPEDLAA